MYEGKNPFEEDSNEMHFPPKILYNPLLLCLFLGAKPAQQIHFVRLSLHLWAYLIRL